MHNSNYLRSLKESVSQQNQTHNEMDLTLGDICLQENLLAEVRFVDEAVMNISASNAKRYMNDILKNLKSNNINGLKSIADKFKSVKNMDFGKKQLYKIADKLNISKKDIDKANIAITKAIGGVLSLPAFIDPIILIITIICAINASRKGIPFDKVLSEFLTKYVNSMRKGKKPSGTKLDEFMQLQRTLLFLLPAIVAIAMIPGVGVVAIMPTALLSIVYLIIGIIDAFNKISDEEKAKIKK